METKRQRQLWANKSENLLMPGVEDAIRNMHGQGLRDKEMAERMGVSVSSIVHIRRGLGIAGHGAKTLGDGARPVNIRFSEDQISRMRAAAAVEGITLRAWIRKRCETT